MLDSRPCQNEDDALHPGSVAVGAPRVLFVAHTCYFDTHNGASIAVRALMECLSRKGFLAAALTGSVLEVGQDLDLEAWLRAQGLDVEDWERSSDPMGSFSSSTVDPISLRVRARGVEVVLHVGPTTLPHAPDPIEAQDFLRLYEGVLDAVRPDLLLSFGGDFLSTEVRRRARARGVAVVFALHNFNYGSRELFLDVDAVIVASRFTANYYRHALGLDCRCLPNLVDFARARADDREPRYVTYVNPSYEKGVYVFARIAEELGRRRPDIPLLVVEGRGNERTLADCGIDLKIYGNVSLMANTPDPRHFWSCTKLCIMPSLWWENQSLVAIEAMLNGIPVIGSDRGGLPETLGDSGVVLGLPPRLTQTTHELPTAEEISPWVEAVIDLWDDDALYAEQSRRAVVESRRWDPDVLEPLYAAFFSEACSRGPRPEPVLANSMPSSPAPAPGLATRQDFGWLLNRLGLLGAGAEIGVQGGIFSRQVLDQWKGSLLYLIDAWQQIPGYEDPANVPPDEQSDRMMATIWRVKPHWERVRLIQELSVNASRLIPDDSLDWVYLDANHEYSSILEDLRIWTPKVKRGGIIAGHDYLDGILNIAGAKTAFGVRQAVGDFFGGCEIQATAEDFPTWYLRKPAGPISANTASCRART